MTWLRSRPILRLPVLLAGVNIIILLLPLGSIVLLRLFENELIRETESELVAQAAFIREIYKDSLAEVLTERGVSMIDYGRLAPPEARRDPDMHFTPIPPRLDLTIDPVLESPESRPMQGPADAIALEAGRRVIPLLESVQRTTLAAMRVVDPAGVVVATSGAELGRSLYHLEETAQALDGEKARRLRKRIPDEPTPSLASISRGHTLRVHVALPIVLDDRVVGAAVLSRTPRDVLKALYDKRHILYVSFAALLLMAGGLAWLTGVAVTRPVTNLVRMTRRIAHGDNPEHPPHALTRELDELGMAFFEMAHAVTARGRAIRAFASHVSHELKTPITSMTGTVELLKDHIDTMESARRDRFLDMLGEDAARMHALVTRLNDLAKAEAWEPGKDEHASLQPMVERLTARYADRGLTVHAELSTRLPTIAMSEDALESVLCNLLDNSLAHGASLFRIRVVTNLAEDAEPGVTVRVADDGPGVSPANAPKIFTPFFTTRREAGGTGLGLAIAAALLKAHHGGIRFVSPETAQTWFRSDRDPASEPAAESRTMGAAFELLLPTPSTSTPAPASVFREA